MALKLIDPRVDGLCPVTVAGRNLLAITCSDGVVRIWHPETGRNRAYTRSSSTASDTLIGVVKEAVRRANVSRISSATDLRVASIQLKLAVVADKSAGGGMNFRVPFIGVDFAASAKVSAKDTHTIDFTLVPPQEPLRREVRGGDIEQVLVQATTTIRDVMASAAADNGSLGPEDKPGRHLLRRHQDRNHLARRRRGTGQRSYQHPPPHPRVWRWMTQDGAGRRRKTARAGQQQATGRCRCGLLPVTRDCWAGSPWKPRWPVACWRQRSGCWGWPGRR